MKQQLEDLLKENSFSLRIKDDADIYLAYKFIDILYLAQNKESIFFADSYQSFFNENNTSSYRRTTIKTQCERYSIFTIKDLFSISRDRPELFKKLCNTKWFRCVLKCLDYHGLQYVDE